MASERAKALVDLFLERMPHGMERNWAAMTPVDRAQFRSDFEQALEDAIMPGPPWIEDIPEDLMKYALTGGPETQVVLVAYLRGKLAGYQLGVREAKCDPR